MSAFTAALVIGHTGAEGRAVGLIYSALALTTFTRMAAVAGGLPADAAYAGLLQLIPTVCWAVAGAAMVYLVMRVRAPVPVRT
jgi:hypothetical protein